VLKNRTCLAVLLKSRNETKCLAEGNSESVADMLH